jgi:hypothetical protein
MTQRLKPLVLALGVACLFSADAMAQDATPASSGSAAHPTTPAKPKAGAPRKRPGKSPAPDPAESAKPDATPSAAVPAARPTGKRKPGSKSAETTTTPDSAKPDTPAPAAGARAPHEVVEHESRIEFDERMVRGQTAAGAIYLFQRAPTEFKSIVQVPDSFRVRTTSMLALRRAAP